MATRENQPELRQFTTEELKQYTGQDGQPTYTAYQGKVYDVSESKFWRNGQHLKKHDAGIDLTAHMDGAPHGADVMEQVKLVGELSDWEPMAEPPPAEEAKPAPTPTPSPAVPTAVPSRSFTPEELAEFEGKEGRAAYTAYRGKVYDVTASKLWRDGVHVRAHKAGEDLTGSMPAAPHEDDVMDKFPVVGTVIEEEPEETSRPWPVDFSLEHHLHPIAVHFPTGLGVSAGLFMLASLLFMGQNTGGDSSLWAGLQHAAFWTVLVCFLTTVPSIITGWISWYFNYAAIMTPIYRAKWTWSIVLVIIGAAAVGLKLLALDGFHVPEPNGAAFWVYVVVVVLHAPVVITLGHYGGKITFPS